MSRWKVVAIVCDSIIGIGLVSSGLIHLSNPYFFLEAVLNYSIVNSIFTATLVSALLIQINLIVGCCKIFRIFKSESAWASVMLFSVFIIAQFLALQSGDSVGCGCFGATDEQIGIATVLRTSMFLVLSVFSLIIISKTDGNRRDHSLNVDEILANQT